VSANRQFVQSSFVRAWREWPEARRFPSIQASVPRNDVISILNASANRRRPILAAWETGAEYVPYLLVDWPVEEVGEVLEESTGVGLEAWKNLARRFIESMGEDKVRRLT
jgi:hypothetical protein